MPDFTIKVRGLSDLSRALRRAPVELRRELPTLVRAAVKPAHAEARAAAPVGPSGALKRGTKLTVRRAGAAIVVPRDPYGVVLFGRKAHVRSHSRRGGHVRGYTRRLTPDPYPLKVLDRHEPRIARELGDGISRLFVRLFDEGGR